LRVEGLVLRILGPGFRVEDLWLSPGQVGATHVRTLMTKEFSYL
jgi:hypothetical protein